MVAFALDGPRQGPANGSAPTSLAILLHGVGSDGNDLMGLVPHWANLLPGTEFVSPHAPYPYDMADQGRQWFSIGDSSVEAMLEGIEKATIILQKFIEEELSRTRVNASRLVLVGFSQGTMMGLHLGLCANLPMAGILGYSGRMIAGPGARKNTSSRLPVMLIHGDRDELVPVTSMLEAVQELSSHGALVQWHICAGLGHSIDQKGLMFGGKFLRDCVTGMAADR